MTRQFHTVEVAAGTSSKDFSTYVKILCEHKITHSSRHCHLPIATIDDGAITILPDKTMPYWKLFIKPEDYSYVQSIFPLLHNDEHSGKLWLSYKDGDKINKQEEIHRFLHAFMFSSLS